MATKITITWVPDREEPAKMKVSHFNGMHKVDKLDFLTDAIALLQEKYNYILRTESLS